MEEEKIIRTTLNEIKLNELYNNKEDIKSVTKYINIVEVLNLNTILTKDGMNEILSIITEDVNTQDAVLDLVTYIYFRLKMNGIDMANLETTIRQVFSTLSNDPMLPESLKKILTPTDVTESILVPVTILIKIYGIK